MEELRRKGFVNKEEIPITTGFLEKNGFAGGTRDRPASYVRDYRIINDVFDRPNAVVQVEVFAKSVMADTTGRMLLNIGYSDDIFKQISLDIRYVHQLQDAMRLCGLLASDECLKL